MLGAISSQEMAPFFDGFLLHLYCAMTHIYDDVKKDSLQVTVYLVLEILQVWFGFRNMSSD